MIKTLDNLISQDYFERMINLRTKKIFLVILVALSVLGVYAQEVMPASEGLRGCKWGSSPEEVIAILGESDLAEKANVGDGVFIINYINQALWMNGDGSIGIGEVTFWFNDAGLFTVGMIFPDQERYMITGLNLEKKYGEPVAWNSMGAKYIVSDNVAAVLKKMSDKFVVMYTCK
jgi:hypothetical protein